MAKCFGSRLEPTVDVRVRFRLMATRCLFAFSVVTAASSAKPQTSSGHGTTGPYHRPAIVKNEYGGEDQALLVYEDKAVEMYVPDVTDEHGYTRLEELMEHSQRCSTCTVGIRNRHVLISCPSTLRPTR